MPTCAPAQAALRTFPSSGDRFGAIHTSVTHSSIPPDVAGRDLSERTASHPAVLGERVQVIHRLTRENGPVAWRSRRRMRSHFDFLTTPDDFAAHPTSRVFGAAPV